MSGDFSYTLFGGFVVELLPAAPPSDNNFTPSPTSAVDLGTATYFIIPDQLLVMDSATPAPTPVLSFASDDSGATYNSGGYWQMPPGSHLYFDLDLTDNPVPTAASDPQIYFNYAPPSSKVYFRIAVNNNVVDAHCQLTADGVQGWHLDSGLFEVGINRIEMHVTQDSDGTLDFESIGIRTGNGLDLQASYYWQVPENGSGHVLAHTQSNWSTQVTSGVTSGLSETSTFSATLGFEESAGVPDVASEKISASFTESLGVTTSITYNSSTTNTYADTIPDPALDCAVTFQLWQLVFVTEIVSTGDQVLQNASDLAPQMLVFPAEAASFIKGLIAVDH